MAYFLPCPAVTEIVIVSAWLTVHAAVLLIPVVITADRHMGLQPGSAEKNTSLISWISSWKIVDLLGLGFDMAVAY